MSDRPDTPDTCASISPECPLDGTVYGYYPSLPANAFFAAFFGLCLLLQLALGTKYKTWTFMIALGFGCFGEMLGYIGRIMLHNNPWDGNGFQIQICCLIISPAFVSAGLYLTLKHIAISFGESWSRLPPVWYTRIFIAGDLFSLVLQGVGGGMAATADPGSHMQDVGTNLMIAGVVFQVVTLAIFGLLLAEYTLRTYNRRNSLSQEAVALIHKTSFRLFIFAIVIAYLGVLIRCIYRIPELTAGWASDLMRNETDFIVLEGVMIVISVLVLTIFHPGLCFPALGNSFKKQRNVSRNKIMDENSDGEMMSARV